jgi:hypothetical protein
MAEKPRTTFELEAMLTGACFAETVTRNLLGQVHADLHHLIGTCVQLTDLCKTLIWACQTYAGEVSLPEHKEALTRALAKVASVEEWIGRILERKEFIREHDKRGESATAAVAGQQ